MAQMDQVGWLSQAREEGREEGWEEGWEKGQEEGWEKGQEKGQEKKALKTASNLLAMGLTPEQVSKGVELPLETVEKIAHEIKQENGSL
jgi:predicted transposase YdaD